MKILLSWLKEFVETHSSAEKIAEAFTLAGLEVDAIQKQSSKVAGKIVDDFILEVSLTPNLVHAANLQGAARELAALENLPLKSKSAKIQEDPSQTTENAISIQITAQEFCPRYSCRVIHGCKVFPSPEWLQERLIAAGMRPVNNIVDATNYIMLELGHPLHAFDLEKIEGNKIIVRLANAQEKITTLNGQEHSLNGKMLVIADAKKPIAIAGIMGGENTEVSDKTTSIVIEAAYFEPKQVRRTSKQLQLRSDGSYRFERGADPNATLQVLDRVSELIVQIAGGKVAKGVLDIGKTTFDPLFIELGLTRLNRLLGTQLSLGEVETILKRLGFGVKSKGIEKLTIVVPTYRHDVQAEIDLIEEVARLYGYHNLHKTHPPMYRQGNLPNSANYLFERQIRQQMIQEGLQEILTCNLISPKEVELIHPAVMPERALVKLLNPSSIDHSLLRPSLLPGMVSAYKYNFDHENPHFAAFEVGRIHFKSKEKYLEPTMLSILLASSLTLSSWHQKAPTVDFYDLKGVLENCFSSLKIPNIQFEPSNFENFHPNIQARITVEGTVLGQMGQLHPALLQTRGIERPLFFAEINLSDLRSFTGETIKMVPLPLFPSSRRDWTFSLHTSVPIEEVYQLINKTSGALLERFSLIGLYQNEKMGKEWINVTFHFVYRDLNETISLSAVEKEHEKITQNVLLSLEKVAKGKAL